MAVSHTDCGSACSMLRGPNRPQYVFRLAKHNSDYLHVSLSVSLSHPLSVSLSPTLYQSEDPDRRSMHQT